MVRVKKNDADIQNAFLKCVCGAARAAHRKASSENRKFLLKRKASSEERWVHTHIGFRNTVQLCLQIFRSCVWKSRTATERFCKRTSFSKTRTVGQFNNQLMSLNSSDNDFDPKFVATHVSVYGVRAVHRP